MICGIAGRRPAVAAGSAVRAVVCRPCRWPLRAAGGVLSGAIVASYRARLRSVGGVGIVFLGGDFTAGTIGLRNGMLTVCMSGSKQNWPRLCEQGACWAANLQETGAYKGRFAADSGVVGCGWWFGFPVPGAGG